MVPEVLILGDPSRREAVFTCIAALGYHVVPAQPGELNRRVRGDHAPALIVMCTADVDAPVLMAGLRRSRQGAAIPVILYGKLGETIRDLADVLDLGADHFIEEPGDDEQWHAVLEELAGPVQAHANRSSGSAANAQPVSEAREPEVEIRRPFHTEVLRDSDHERRPVPRATRVPASRERRRDSLMGHLHRTLDALEDRLRGRDPSPSGPEPAAREELDDLDLPPLDLAGLSEDAGDDEIVDPAESQERMDMVLVHGRQPNAVAIAGQPDSTMKLPSKAAAQVSGTAATAEWSRDANTRARANRLSAAAAVFESTSLADVEVPRLLWRLHRARFDGKLVLTRGRVEKQLWLLEGSVVFARSNLSHDRLVDELFRRGMLARDQYESARRLAAKEPRRAGQILVEAGYLKPSELHSALRLHLLRIVDSTFAWSDGAYALVPGEPCDEAVLLDVPTPALIFEGIRERLDIEQIIEGLGGTETYPSLTATARSQPGGVRGVAEQLRLSSSEESWLARLDGRTSIDRLALEAGADEAELLALVYALHLCELLDLTGEPPPRNSEVSTPADIDRQRIMARLRLAREADYFALLGIPRSAKRAEVRRAHAELSRLFADENLEPETRESLHDPLAEVRVALDEAMTILLDDSLRSAYLAHLDEP